MKRSWKAVSLLALGLVLLAARPESVPAAITDEDATLSPYFFEVAKSHGGTVRVTNRPEVGAVAELTLPRGDQPRRAAV